MDFYGFDRAAAVAHCDSLALGRAGRETSAICSWNRVRPEHVIDLLDRAAPEARADGRNLAALITRMPWRIRDQPVAQGGARLVNNVREIEVSVASRTWRLHCTETPSLKLERIST
ncbi:hypothetical protein E5843_09095 [Luteimonas yindakuii]|uniref:hypothetical protein n=1 Tax=Luteimonas yindakuii TaxID=2565782 RepID=UPI0010A2C100|nr:hypothetical protein [Luteimonas yindakuii]QCO67878.1 hypothetical protein E5843_09095 [Luteimonas yindakuii]